ncbi:type I glyceraldehyde-3-phosphate dehydrogenase [Asanoa sp. NPDC049518]|uniref:type I glyceraldehyde-3-phosphate dehydrogenase n=1 Tax=unclassified Asanoa TaxID=2685164 RepID=UPI0034460FDD
MLRVAINGLGRIGRAYLRALVERGLLDTEVQVVGVNDLWDTATLAHLIAYDSTFGKAKFPVGYDADSIKIGERGIPAFRERDPVELPWQELNVDLVIESTGKLRTRESAAGHLKAGARRVLISAPGKGVDVTLVPGVNDHEYDPVRHEILSAASCTTNCAAPMVKVLHDAFGVERGFLTTVHAYTNDQMLIDSPHKDPRRARSAAVNIVPTSTGAAKAIGLVIPEVAGLLDGVALRVPVEDGSLVDLACQLATPVSAEAVNSAFATAATEMAGVLSYVDGPLVSRDIVGDPASCVFDARLTQAAGTFVKVFGWYDNEWGYTNRLVDLTTMIAAGE